jgi:hypothetical protein
MAGLVDVRAMAPVESAVSERLRTSPATTPEACFPGLRGDNRGQGEQVGFWVISVMTAVMPSISSLFCARHEMAETAFSTDRDLP